MSKKNCLLISVIIVILIVVLLACAGICVLFSSAFSSYDLESLSTTVEADVIRSGGDEKIVVIDVEGVITDAEQDTSLFGSGIASSRQITRYIDQAMEDSNVKAIIFSHDTPGGDVYASDVIRDKILEAQAKGIKVVTLMRGVSASGGYYIAAPSDEIIANEITITGSIGVLMQFQSLAGLYEKLGIETVTITNSEGEYKTGEGLFDDDPNGEEDQIYQSIVDEAFDRFLTVVADGRDMEKSEVLKIADGRIFTGKQALDAGLVDELGGMDEAVASAEEMAGITDATIVHYKEYDFWSSLMGYVASVANPVSSLAGQVDTTPGPKLRYLYVSE